jgi:predicted esterase
MMMMMVMMIKMMMIMMTAVDSFIANSYLLDHRYDITGLTDRASESCEGIEDTVSKVRAMLQAENALGVSYSRMALAGFSQGGATSLFTGLQLPIDMKLAGILVMSGYLPGASKFKITPGLEDVPVMHCHGTADPVVSGYIYIYMCIYKHVYVNRYFSICVCVYICIFIIMLFKDVPVMHCHGTADPVVSGYAYVYMYILYSYVYAYNILAYMYIYAYIYLYMFKMSQICIAWHS